MSSTFEILYSYIQIVIIALTSGPPPRRWSHIAEIIFNQHTKLYYIY
jgi:hypothetical protein